MIYRNLTKVSLLSVVLITLVSGLRGTLNAQTTITCGTGTSSSYNTPFNDYYKNSWNEAIYTQAEMSAAAGCNITKIAYQSDASNSTTLTATTLKIYMGERATSDHSTTSDWTGAGSLQLVYSGTNVTLGNVAAGSWQTFTLNTPFSYTGEGNLVVVVAKTTSTYNSSCVWRYSTVSGVNYPVLYRQNDSYTDYAEHPGSNTGTQYSNRANTKFTYSNCCSVQRTGTFEFQLNGSAVTSCNYTVGNPLNLPTLVNNLTPAGTPSFSSSNTAVATVNATTGQVSIANPPIEGSTVISAYIPVSGSTCAKFVSYILNVNDGCLVIGTGTSTTESAPLMTGWKNSYEQMIYTTAEVGIGMIHSIGFQAAASNSTPRQVDIYMGEVDRATFASSTDWVPVSQLEHVYTGTWNIAAGWNMFPVDFLYTGVGNLVIAVDCGAPSYTYSNFYYTTTSGTTTIYAYSDDYDAVPANINNYQGYTYSLTYRPNTKICIDACSIRPTFEFENSMAMCYLGNNCPMLPLDNTSSGALSFTSSDESVATVDDMGNITTYTMGETTIEAMVQMDGQTCPAKASYVLQVICPALIPSAQSVSLCEGGQVTLTASTPGGGTLQWFDAVDATTPIASGDSYTTNAQHSTTYYVATYNADYDCYSSRVPAYVNIFDFGYASSSQNISGYVGVTMYGYPPEGTTPGATFTATGMPAWMTLNSSDGSFSGTPTAAGSGTFTITASNGTCSASVTIHWTVVANNLTCCDPSAFYIFKQGEPRPIQMEADGYYYINVCKDEAATFRVQPIANCTGYTYNWRLASSTGGLLEIGTNQTFTYTYDRAMGYNMTLTIRKGTQCSTSIPIRIRVAGAFQVATRPSFDLCKGEPFNIYVSSDGIGSVDVVRPYGGSATTLGVTDTVWLPDGVPCNGSCFFRSCVTFSDFPETATIRDENDLLYVLLNIEHSFIGDIYIALTCPDNHRSVILPQSGNGASDCRSEIPSGYDSWPGGSTNTSYDFGISGSGYSSDCDTPGTIGTGWNYIWSNNTNPALGYQYAGGTYGYVYETANVGHDNTSSVDSSHFSDMSQIYHPMESFSNMIGCHLNGTWCIEVVDGWGIDDGHIFHWELGLNPELLPDSWDYSVDIDSAWVDCGWPSSKSGVYMEITPPNDFVGTTGCDLYLRDEYGCISHYNNIVTVTMYDSEGSTTHVGPQCEPYYWNISGETYDTSGTYVEQGLTAHGCPNRDTLILVVSGAKYDTVTAQGCQSYDWRGHTYTSSGSYNDTLTSAMGCDSITTLILEILPELTTQKDTAVCPITYPFDFYNSHFTAAGTQTQNLQTTDGCDSIVTITVTTLPKPEVTLSTIADDCPIPTSSNYTVTPTVTGGTSPFTYAWTGDYTGTDQNATIPGTNTCGDFSVEVIVTDQNGCMDTANTSWHAVDTELPNIDNLTETPALLTNNNCEYKVPDLLTMLNISDNCQVKTQTQDPPANDIITAETDVIVTVEDLCGNISTQTVHLTIPDPLTADIDNTNVACNGGHNGTVTLSNIQGGTTPYTFSWNTGATTQNLTGQTAGDYSVTISDANGCTLVKNATISESGDLVSTLTPTPVTCYQTATGSIVIDSVVGGTQPYASYQWCNGSTSSTGIDNLMPGEYSLTITDAQGCSITVSATVADRAQLTIEENTAAHQNIDCNGNSTGQLGAIAHGGTGAYTYTLNGTDNNTGIFTGLAAGPYTVTVTDSLTCTNTVDITLTEPDPLQVVHSSTPANCFGESNGSLTVTASHGTSPFTYTLTATGASNNTGIFNGLAAGTYTINIVDANGCPISDVVTVDEPTKLLIDEIDATHIDIACSGEATGRFQVEATQGSPAYTYTMGTTTNSTGIFTGLHAGTYPVTASDSHGCTHDTTIVITELSPISIQETAHQDVNCNGENNGSFTVVASGGAEGFSYVINGGIAQSTGTVPNATAGTYYITATDANGCFIKDTVIITQPTLLTISENTNAHQNVRCFGTSTASVTVYGSGGTSPYTYYLDAQQNTSGVFASQIMGDYTARVVDNHGCEATMPINITEPPALTLGIVGTNLRCKLDGTGAIDLSVNGGTPVYTYLWNNNATTQDLQNLQAGTYSVTVTDRNSCTHDTSIVITEPEGMILTMSPDQTICNHESVNIWATVQQGTRPYRFRWNNGSTDSAQTVTPSATTTYQFQVTDQNDCSLTDNVTITVNYQSTGIDEQNHCDTYTWPANGATYTESTNAPQVTGLTNAAGCDSTAILHLTIRYSTEGTDIQTGCDVFRWGHNGQSYTTSTTDPQVTIHNANRAGCDSTIHLDLTINHSITVHDTTAHICENAEPFIWNGMAYHQSGTFSALLHTYLGCDSTVTMTLLVHDTNHSYVYDTCFVKELPWSYNGREYPTPVYDDLFTLENRWGCDSIVHYNLEAIFDCSEFLQFPSVVTPNGDGINDIFQVVGLLEQECYPLNRLTIYNRWGAKIYEVNNIDEIEDFWDPEKERTPAGTYYYRFDGDGFRGHVERKGVIEVVR